jgi:2-polyprenyl-3-methyl-5-hydroxy-6-metoxy-1,4-benzoquinol methylase
MSTIVNYSLCRLWVFEKHGARLNKQIVEFFAVALIGLIGEFSIFNIFLINTSQAFLSTLVAMGLMFFVNFYLKQRLFDNKERRNRLRQLHKAYSKLSWSSRIHMYIRWHSCPIEVIDAYLPDNGQLLEIGCGRGIVSLWSALLRPKLNIYGNDIDEHKIADAKLAAKNLRGSTQKIDFGIIKQDKAVPVGPWQAIVIFDVLYLMTRQQQLRLLKDASKQLDKGGVLIIKLMSPKPAWKARFALWQENVSVRVLGLTSGNYPFTFLTPQEVSDCLQNTGLRTEIHQIDKGYPHPHLLIVGRK